MLKTGGRAQLDLGCGANKAEGFVGMDVRELPGVDIVHDLEDFPWPVPHDSCMTIIASHLVEHIKPWHSIEFMNECWICLERDIGRLLISTPYPGSRGFWQDPTHCNGWNETTWQYFDPRYPLYGIYKPYPWEIEKGFPVYQQQGNLEVILRKISKEEGEKRLNDRGFLQGKPIGISVADSAKMSDKVGG